MAAILASVPSRSARAWSRTVYIMTPISAGTSPPSFFRSSARGPAQYAPTRPWPASTAPARARCCRGSDGLQPQRDNRVGHRAEVGVLGGGETGDLRGAVVAVTAPIEHRDP